MIALILFLTCVLVALGFGVMAAMSDFRGMVIPNVYSVIIFAAFAVCYGGLWVFGVSGVFMALLSHVLAFVVVFVVTLGLFALKIWGGGDQKLMSAFAIWMGVSGLLPFLFYTAVFGGVLGFVALGLQKIKPVKSPKEGSWIQKVQSGDGNVPYGIAITLGAIAAFVKVGYFSVDTLRIFIMG